MTDTNFLAKLTPNLDWNLKSVIYTRVSMHFRNGHQKKTKPFTKEEHYQKIWNNFKKLILKLSIAEMTSLYLS